ncbi:hypothetical protein [Palleronia sp. LCG004]|uniref:hypothetical protein n=1 Tax=Palleronia sp. LCG004 TaxID=3079304 RepID=UPI002942BFA7|nr:hypothetical protein [Palleronia sp. LCG004]WOI57136.1 hypothetical protein RVY76_04920 [Palleronia sp. LCG004]
MSDHRTPDEIEAELRENREGLQNTLVALQNTFSPETIFRSISDNAREHGGEWGRSISHSAQQNPLALAVAGIGLGWLIFGRGPSASHIDQTIRRAADDDTTIGGGRKTAYGADADASIGPRGPVPEGSGPNWITDADRGPSAGQRLRAGVRSGRRSVSDNARSARHGAESAAGRIRDRSSDMQRRLSEGTERMSEEARERIIAARERAIVASERASAGIGRGADRAVDFFDEHPLVAGALAFAVGAAIAGSLPRTRYEDEYFGEESDHLYDEAERVFAEEREKLERVAGAALDEAREVGEEVREDADAAARDAKDRADRESHGEGSAADAAVDRAEGAAKRVADAARDEAEKQNLGHPSNS